ncbi:MAG: hypothetical protein A2Y97_01400 [Nitrospirae bacterium RBG_13_39_12]|nr:MAG: hypothetical protein A2Y97_01400 [Nitrospirae bacterium RBG_13_39_12]
MQILRTGISSKRGFTLLELIVVLFVISLVMAIVLPSFSGFGERNLKSEAREMASILRYMNDSAISRKETFFIRFDLDERMVHWKGPDGEKAKRFDNITGITAQSTGKVSKGEITFFFEPVGIQENLSVYMVSSNKEMSICLNHLSGRVKIVTNTGGSNDKKRLYPS